MREVQVFCGQKQNEIKHLHLLLYDNKSKGVAFSVLPTVSEKKKKKKLSLHENCTFMILSTGKIVSLR